MWRTPSNPYSGLMNEATPELQDCVLCGLPAEVGVEFDIDDDPWLTLVCVQAHMVTLPLSDFEMVLRQQGEPTTG